MLRWKYFVFSSIVSAIEAQYLVKVLVISQGLVVLILPSRDIALGTFEVASFKERSNLISVQVLLMFFQLFLVIRFW